MGNCGAISGGQMTHSISFVEKTTFNPAREATHGTFLRIEQIDAVDPSRALPEFAVKVAVNRVPLVLTPPFPHYSGGGTCVRRAVEIPMTPSNVSIRVTTPTRDETFTVGGGDVVAK